MQAKHTLAQLVKEANAEMAPQWPASFDEAPRAFQEAVLQEVYNRVSDGTIEWPPDTRALVTNNGFRTTFETRHGVRFPTPEAVAARSAK